jgi:hypothetical protein
MPATFGVTSDFGSTAPQGYMQSSEQTVTCEIATIKNETGRVVEAQQKPRSLTTVTIKSKGSASLATVTSGTDFNGMTIVSSKYSESNDDFGTSETVGNLYE